MYFHGLQAAISIQMGRECGAKRADTVSAYPMLFRHTLPRLSARRASRPARMKGKGEEGFHSARPAPPEYSRISRLPSRRAEIRDSREPEMSK